MRKNIVVSKNFVSQLNSWWTQIILTHQVAEPKVVELCKFANENTDASKRAYIMIQSVINLVSYGNPLQSVLFRAESLVGFSTDLFVFLLWLVSISRFTMNNSTVMQHWPKNLGLQRVKKSTTAELFRQSTTHSCHMQSFICFYSGCLDCHLTHV